MAGLRALLFIAPLAAAAVPTVYVDDDFTGPPGSVIADADASTEGDQPATIGTDAFATIGAGIAAADAGGVVVVGAGTYQEGNGIAKTVTIRGRQAGVSATSGRSGAEETIISNATGAFALTADGIVIDGVVIQDQSNGTFAPGFGAAVYFNPGFNGRKILNCIFQDNIIGLYASNSGGDPAIIQHNLFRANNNPGPGSGHGIYLDEYTAGTVSNLLIDSNRFEGHTGSSGTGGQGIGFSVTDPTKASTNVRISNNVFSGNGRALYALNLTNSEIVGNSFSGALWAASADLRLSVGCTNLTIAENVFENGAGSAIRVGSSETPAASEITVTRNFIGEYDGTEIVVGEYSGTFDASANYWGTNDPAEVLARTTGPVDITPLLPKNESSSDQGVVGFQADLSEVMVHTIGEQAGSKSRVQEGSEVVALQGTVTVLPGTYLEDSSISRSVTIAGVSAATTTLLGKKGGTSATLSITAPAVSVRDLTITREGNTVEDWNEPTLNSAGISISSGGSGAVVYNNVITGNRTGIDVNNTSGHTIRNNVINLNRTGLIFRNQTDNLTVEENVISDNFTVGVLFLDASGGTNSPVQSALDSSFTNNDISGNWYGQVVDRQAGGALPQPGDNVKDFSRNWFGTNQVRVVTVDSMEPGYAAQIPTVFGGTATAPEEIRPEIAGAGSANIPFDPVLNVGTDTDKETIPGRGTFGFQGLPTHGTRPALAATTGTGSLIDVLYGRSGHTLLGISSVTGGSATIVGSKVRFKLTDLVNGGSFAITATDGNGNSYTELLLVSPSTEASGSYVGLLRRADGSVRGRVTLTVSTSGEMTGTIKRENVTLPFKGSLLGAGKSLNSSMKAVRESAAYPGPLSSEGQPTVSITVPDAIAGTLSGTLERSPYDAANPAPEAGRYSIVGELAAGGSGPALGSALSSEVAPNGNVTIRGNLGDGTAVSLAGRLLAGGRFPFYAAAGRGATLRRMSGEQVYEPSGSPAVSGTLRWNIPADALRTVPEGVDADYDTFGLAYVPAAQAMAMFEPAADSGMLSFEYDTPVERSVRLNGRARHGVQAVSFAGGRISFLPGTGVFRGSFRTPFGATRSFFGVVLQGSGYNVGRGNLLESQSIVPVSVSSF